MAFSVISDRNRLKSVFWHVSWNFKILRCILLCVGGNLGILKLLFIFILLETESLQQRLHGNKMKSCSLNGVWWCVAFLLNCIKVGNFGCGNCLLLFFSGETCIASSSATYPLEWWRSSNRCLLGTLLSFWWSKWQNSSCDWSWCLSTTCGASSVSSFIFPKVKYMTSILTCVSLLVSKSELCRKILLFTE